MFMVLTSSNAPSALKGDFPVLSTRTPFLIKMPSLSHAFPVLSLEFDGNRLLLFSHSALCSPPSSAICRRPQSLRHLLGARRAALRLELSPLGLFKMGKRCT